MQGWISLHRKIQEHWLYQEKRKFSKFEAWIDLLMMVNHKDNKIMIGSELILVEKGSKITSVRKLCERWNWSNSKVVTFLKTLESDKMINYKSDTKKTVLSIVNYSNYQSEATLKATQKRHESDTNQYQKHTNNNVNNDNNENKKDTIPYKEIISYLNNKSKSNYRPSSKKSQSLIVARWNEGYRLDDFKKVIDIKCKEWINDSKMCNFLRPETLFSNKFESYYNQKETKKDDKKLTPQQIMGTL